MISKQPEGLVAGESIEAGASVEVNPNGHLIPVGTYLTIDGKHVGVVTEVKLNDVGQMVGEVQLDLALLPSYRVFSTGEVTRMTVETESKPQDLLREIRKIADIERRKKWFLSVDRPGWVLIEAASNLEGQALVTDNTGQMRWVDMNDDNGADVGKETTKEK